MKGIGPWAAALLVCFTGCATQGDWGSHATLTPGWHRVKSAAVGAAKDPKTWVPLAAAALFSIDDYDQQTVDWAARHNPLFGNVSDAKDTSDLLRDLSAANWLATSFAASTRPGAEGMKHRAQGIALGLAAMVVNDQVTDGVKSLTHRQRPDRDTHNSFPSGHTSAAAISATLADRNIEYVNIPDTSKRLWQVAGYTLAGLTGWARVEAERHYPSDVLAGFALGHFLGAFLNDVFIDPPDQDKIALTVNARGTDAVLVGVEYHW